MFGRRRRVPAKLRPALVKDERVVAWAPATQGGAVVVTTLGAWLPGRAERLGWHQVHKATWSGTTLTVIGSVPVASEDGYDVMADDAPIVVSLTDPDKVPHEVRQRVTRSVAYTSHHALPGGGVRVVARRVPGANGVVWQVRYDDGTDRTDPEVAEATAALVQEASAPPEQD